MKGDKTDRTLISGATCVGQKEVTVSKKPEKGQPEGEEKSK